MCGGRGTRLGGDTEKPLVRVAGRPMVDRVFKALTESRIERVYTVVSPHAPATRAHLTERAAECAEGGTDRRVLDAPGDGYVADLQYVLTETDANSTAGSDFDFAIDPPVLTVAADLPLLDGKAIARVIDTAVAAESDSLTVCVPAARKRDLGVSADGAFETDGRSVVPAGINVVARVGGNRDGGADDLDDALHVTDDYRFAVNVNYPSDVQIAEALLTEGSTDH